MKRRILTAILVLTVSLVLAGCAKADTESGKNTEETGNTEPVDDTKEAETDESTPDGEDSQTDGTQATTDEVMKQIDLDKCITLGEYKGITVEKTIQTATDEEIQEEIEETLLLYPIEVTDSSAQVQTGDTVNIDYVGRMDGAEFEGGSDQDADLRIGSGQFIEGFEGGLIGAVKGQTVVLDITFPQGYSESLSGKAVEFTVTINAIKRPIEEPTDEWVAANVEGYYTVEEWEAGIRAQHEAYNGEVANDQVRYNAWMIVVDSSTINEYPEPLVEIGKKVYQDAIEEDAAYASMSVEDYVTAMGSTMEDYEANMEEYGKNIAARSMICYALSKQEGFALGDEDYQARMQELCEELQCTEEELIAYNGRDMVEQNIMLNRVVDFIMENANVIETTLDNAVSQDADTQDEAPAE